ncbi:anti-sigma factor [Pseudarthrobacter enclensis]|uniref:anti-sigma factor n=1 Tax=Pseudarthrobacter enclensis TaxID=993070 RepID=UPI00343BD77C
MKSPFPAGGKHPRTSGHLSSCPECALAVRRERQYLERLRDAPIPPASDNLTARLLAHTSQLAAQPLPAAPSATVPRTAARVLAMTAGGTVAAAGVLAVGAFAAAGDPLAAPPVTTTALSQVSAHTPADGRALTTEQIGSLRQEGWACPVLESMGFHLESARAVVRGGQPAVELRLSDGDHYAKVVEQHAGSTAATLRPAGQQGGQQAAAPQDSAPPWTATYTAGGRTFSFESDLPAEQADDAGPILQRVGSLSAEGVSAGVEHPGQGQGEEPLGSRLQRGINKIVATFTR